MSTTKAPWHIGHGHSLLVLGLDQTTVAVCRTEDDARLIAAAPIGHELADCILAEAQDGIDRSAYMLEKAREFMKKAGVHIPESK